MKAKLLSVAAFSLISASMFAQLPVNTSPQNKKFILEEFTGENCGYCPDGHKIATQIYNADPTHVVIVNIHQGGYAAPGAGQQDFRTGDGNSIGGMPGMSIQGYPTGDGNRTIFSALSYTAMATMRNDWNTMATTIKSQPAYCNVALQGTVNAQTRVLTVQAQVYYTANSPATTNSLTIMLIEDGIPGYQHDYGNFNPTNWNADGTYNHHHVLRKALTPTFGTSVTPTTSGSLYSGTFTYTVPTQFPATGVYTTSCLLGRLQLVGFVTESNTLTINGAYGPVYITNITNQRDLGMTSLSVETEACAGIINPKYWFTNYGSDTATTATFTYAINGGAPATYTWTGSCPPYTQQLITMNNMTFTPIAGTNTLVIGVNSINGNTDQNSSNNIMTKTITTTTLLATNLNMQMDFTQDQYGSEDTWQVIDEVSNTIIAQDGPFSDLTSAGTLLHTKTFTLTNNTCYKLAIQDAYGDGACCAYGNGSYYLKSGGNTIFGGPANYGAGLTKLFKTDIAASVSNVIYANNVYIYPNPTSDNVNVKFELYQNDNVTITLVNSLGQTVYSAQHQNIGAGEHELKIPAINLAEGIYNLNLKTSKESFNKKVTIAH